MPESHKNRQESLHNSSAGRENQTVDRLYSGVEFVAVKLMEFRGSFTGADSQTGCM